MPKRKLTRQQEKAMFAKGFKKSGNRKPRPSPRSQPAPIRRTSHKPVRKPIVKPKKVKSLTRLEKLEKKHIFKGDMISTPSDLSEYFDDIDGAIEMLEIEADVCMDSEAEDEMRDRIDYLKKRKRAGDTWVDNDTTKSPKAWKNLPTYNNKEALEAYLEWI